MSQDNIQPPTPLPPTVGVPIGTIVAYIANTANIPSGWLLCNGQVIPPKIPYTGPQVPALAGLTLIGQGQNYNLGEIGGEATHTLSTAEIPAHTHPIHGGNFGALGTQLEIGDSGYVPYCTEHVFGATGTDSTGGGGAHNNMQPYYVAYYIMYVGFPTSKGLLIQ